MREDQFVPARDRTPRRRLSRTRFGVSAGLARRRNSPRNPRRRTSPRSPSTATLPELARSQNNLAARAARSFMSEFDLLADVPIDLEKRIPVGRRARRRIERRRHDVVHDGGGGAAHRRSRGEQAASNRAVARRRRAVFSRSATVAREPESASESPRSRDVPRFPIVIAVPPFEVSTAAIFARSSAGGWSGAAPDAHIEAIARGEISAALAVNDLAPVAIAQFPEIRRLKGLLEDLGARAAQMSGSGGAVFGVFESADEAESAAMKIRKRAPFATVIRRRR